MIRYPKGWVRAEDRSINERNPYELPKPLEAKKFFTSYLKAIKFFHWKMIRCNKLVDETIYREETQLRSIFDQIRTGSLTEGLRYLKNKARNKY